MFNDREIRLALKIILMAALVGIIILVLVRLAPVISLIVVALFIVYCINPLVRFLMGIRLRPVLASTIASLIILLALILFFYLLIPGLIIEMRQLVVYLTTEFIRDVPSIVTELQELDKRFNLQLTDSFVEYSNQFIRQAPGNVQVLLRNLTLLSMNLVAQIWVILILIFLVFYLVQDLEKVRENITLLFPQIYKENVVHLLSTIDEKVGAYIRGTLLKCLFVGLLTWLGLQMLNMPFALLLGITAGLFNIILYIGPVAATIPALLLSIMPGTPSFILVLLLYVVVQVLDALLFTPIFLGKATDLSPLTVIIIVLIGGQLMGLLGIILAIPITATFKVLLLHYYLEKRQNEEAG